MHEPAYLKLSTGEVFEGELIGAPLSNSGCSSGQLVFTTGMVGYTETLTDPSYFGQIITFAYPLIGNYGVPQGHESKLTGFESDKIFASGLVIGRLSQHPSHWNSVKNLDQWLKEQNISGIAGIDTRALVSHITHHPNVLAKICVNENESNKFFDPNLTQVIDQVSVKKIQTIGTGKYKIGLIDCGAKWNMVRMLDGLDCSIDIYPWDSDFSKASVDGWLISNGPGDPEKTGDLVKRIQKLLTQNKPVLGICLGFQLMALAAGAKTKRLPFGHRSFNQPVQLVGSLKGFLTSQNHGFVVDHESLPKDWAPWFVNANDQTLEGIKHTHLPFYSVQFHPESSGGPNDTKWIIQDFVNDVKKRK